MRKRGLDEGEAGGARKGDMNRWTSGGRRDECAMNPLVVLLVDHNPIFLQNIVRFLDLYGDDHLVLGGAVLDATEGLGLSKLLRPDVVLWGIGMPALPQIQLLPQLRVLLPHAKIIVLGIVEEGYREAVLQAGADLFLLKDGLEATLLSAFET
jgi:DNA-binding NarL/FixJ family response regulator